MKTTHPYIRAWGTLLGSYDYYIENQTTLAQHEGAPANAVYRNEDGTWATTDGLRDALKAQLEGMIREEQYHASRKR